MHAILHVSIASSPFPGRERGFVSDWPVMKFDLYKKCIDEMALFDDQLKVLRFVGMGEPLLHKNIAEMIAYAVDRECRPPG